MKARRGNFGLSVEELHKQPEAQQLYCLYTMSFGCLQGLKAYGLCGYFSFVVDGVEFISAFAGVVGGGRPTVVMSAVGLPKGMHIERHKENIVERQMDGEPIVKPRDDAECDQEKKPWLIGVQQLGLQSIRCHYHLADRLEGFGIFREDPRQVGEDVVIFAEFPG